MHSFRTQLITRTCTCFYLATSDEDSDDDAEEDTFNHNQTEQDDAAHSTSNDDACSSKNSSSNYGVDRYTSKIGSGAAARSSGSENNVDSLVVKANKRKSDKQMKQFAFATTIADIGQVECSARCAHGRHCLQDTTLYTLYCERVAFWGKEDYSAPTASERKDKIVDILSDAYLKNKEELVFAVIGGRESGLKKRLVCEFALLVIIGLCGLKFQAPRQWNDCKRLLLTGEVKQSHEYSRPSAKYDSAVIFIRYIVELVSDKSPFAGKFV